MYNKVARVAYLRVIIGTPRISVDGAGCGAATIGVSTGASDIFKNRDVFMIIEQKNN
jgi:hypothetical protein